MRVKEIDILFLLENKYIIKCFNFSVRIDDFLSISF